MAALAEMKGINTSGVHEREDNGTVLRFMAVNYYASTLTERSVASYPIRPCCHARRTRKIRKYLAITRVCTQCTCTGFTQYTVVRCTVRIRIYCVSAY